MNETALGLRDYLLILRRRRWWFIIPAVLVLAAAGVAAMLWPPTYRSEATVLIEETDIPQNLSGAVTDEYVEKRFETITRRVMVTDSLLGIIERYDLYPKDRKVLPVTEIVDKMRDDVTHEMVRSDVIDPRTGQKRSITVAFKLSFDYGVPDLAQKVTNELVSLYLNENARQKRARSGETATLLKGEAERAEQQIQTVESTLTDFKKAHAGVLPEDLAFNQQMVSRSESELRELDRQIQSMQQQESMLSVQLSQTDPYLPAPVTSNARDSLDPATRLEGQRTELAALSARYGPTHPDVIRLQREVAGLEKAVGSDTGRDTLQEKRDKLAADLVTLRQRYSPEHPDVRRAERELASVEQALATTPRGGSRAAKAERARNPAYITLDSQLASVRTDLAATKEQSRKTNEVLKRYEELVLRAPGIEQEYVKLQRELDDAKAKRAQLAGMESSAELGQTLQTELQTERLSLIEPPSVPSEPVKPNRKMILFLGAVLGIGAGGGMLALRQIFDTAVWTDKDIARVIGIAPLAVVPRIVTAADIRRRWMLGATAAALLLMMIGAGGYGAYRRYGPFDMLAYDIQRRVMEKVQLVLPDQLRALLPQS